MTKLLLSTSTEAKAIATIWNMAIPSLDPENFEALENALKQLCKTRHIDNEQIA
jgi:hypothetical protein